MKDKGFSQLKKNRIKCLEERTLVIHNIQMKGDWKHRICFNIIGSESTGTKILYVLLNYFIYSV